MGGGGVEKFYSMARHLEESARTLESVNSG